MTNVAMKGHLHTRKPLTGISAGEGLSVVRPKGFEPLTSWSVTDEDATSNVTPLRPAPVGSPEPRRIAA